MEHLPDYRFGLGDALQALASGALSPAAYLEACLQRCLAVEPQLHAFVRVSAAADQPQPGGALRGIPVGVKDLIDTADMPTEYGAEFHRDHRPQRDAAVVQHLRRLGATIFGKTVTTEYAWRHPGPTTNPWHPGHTPGGSSSGSAAAVAAGIVPLALGTQTLGSIIRPAAFCGVVGMKPSFGTISTEGVHPFSPSLDHVGYFVRSAADAATAYDLLAPGDRGGGAGGAGGGHAPTLALVLTGRVGQLSAEQRQVLSDACDRLSAAGARIVPMEFPEIVDRTWDVADVLLTYEAAAEFGERADQAPDRISAAMRETVAAGRAVTPARHAFALAEQADLREQFAAVADFDAVITAPATGIAPSGLGWTGDPGFCTPWTVLGLPAITLPVRRAGGLPLGIQLVGRSGRDRALIALAQWCEPLIREHVGFPEFAAA